MPTVVALIAIIAFSLQPAGAAKMWSDWDKSETPIFEGQYIASDPTVIRDGDIYRMFYTCFIVPDGPFDPATVRSGICQATSDDGRDWQEIDTGDDATPGLVLRGRDGEWDENLESAFIVKQEDRYLLYASGYDHIGDPYLGYPAALTVAESGDGITFTRVQDEPILSPTPGGRDNDAVYSPVIHAAGDGYVMTYAGHCYTACDFGYGNTLLAARSDDGITWETANQPVLTAETAALDWAKDGVAEPDLFLGPDDRWYLFFTALDGDLRRLGVAVGETPYGPWEIAPDPLFDIASGEWDDIGDLAPSVLLVGDTLRMWFLGMSTNEDIAIGYAEAPWPLLQPWPGAGVGPDNDNDPNGPAFRHQCARHNDRQDGILRIRREGPIPCLAMTADTSFRQAGASPPF